LRDKMVTPSVSDGHPIGPTLLVGPLLPNPPKLLDQVET